LPVGCSDNGEFVLLFLVLIKERSNSCKHLVDGISRVSIEDQSSWVVELGVLNNQPNNVSVGCHYFSKVPVEIWSDVLSHAQHYLTVSVAWVVPPSPWTSRFREEVKSGVID